MTILLTGGTGFVGLNVTEALLGRGQHVVAFSNQDPPARAVKEFAGLPGTFDHVVGDVRDRAAIERVFGKFSIDRIVHGAAITPNDARELADPRSVLEVNLLGLVNILVAARDYPVSGILYIGSSGVFGQVDATELTEDHPQQPRSLYGISKSAGEAAFKRLSDLYGLKAVIGRLGWVFGRWEWETGARSKLSAVFQVTRCARESGRAVLPRPNLRDWTYAPDAAANLITMLFADHPGHRVYNLGTGAVWSTADWCDKLSARYPNFSWSIDPNRQGATIDLHSDEDDPPLSVRRFTAEFGAPASRGLDDSFEDYLGWLDRAPPQRTS
jgi:UDP-glucuronate 4-epimerase